MRPQVVGGGISLYGCWVSKLCIGEARVSLKTWFVFCNLAQLCGVENLRVKGKFSNSQCANFPESDGGCLGPGAGHRLRMSLEQWSSAWVGSLSLSLGDGQRAWAQEDRLTS